MFSFDSIEHAYLVKKNGPKSEDFHSISWNNLDP